jgi:hypothetical protein
VTISADDVEIDKLEDPMSDEEFQQRYSEY